ncbi:MAG: FIST C-terminal domain-containing protein [Acidobacteriota bacterium]|jgi:hypothetical protein|nr:FIST C-terminal domain-containing protein [Acidobacteriota bacterium]
MKSASAVSFELDDMMETARELAGSIKQKLVCQRNAIGLLLCDADTDGALLTAELQKMLGFEVAGMTTLAAIDSQGRQDGGVVLTVLTADDCEFFAAVSEPLDADNCEERIADTYNRAVAGGGKPGVLFAFCPSGMDFSGDKYPEVISRIAPGVPLIGGMAFNDYDQRQPRVFLSGQEHTDCLVLVGIRGAVRPVFALRHVTSRFAERIRRITKAEKNVVHTVGNETFVEYLEGFGFNTDVEDPLLAFTSHPMMLTREGADETPLMRHISGLDLKDGSGTFFGDVPVGTLANICLIKKEDIVASCRESMQALLAEGKRHPEYGYSTILCISCGGRAMILGSDADAEGRILAETLPAELTLFGAYGIGEICPVCCKDGHGANRFHNCSITFCMF